VRAQHLLGRDLHVGAEQVAELGAERHERDQRSAGPQIDEDVDVARLRVLAAGDGTTSSTRSRCRQIRRSRPSRSKTSSIERIKRWAGSDGITLVFKRFVYREYLRIIEEGTEQ
jgi:hypothetical protein